MQQFTQEAQAFVKAQLELFKKVTSVSTEVSVVEFDVNARPVSQVHIKDYQFVPRGGGTALYDALALIYKQIYPHIDTCSTTIIVVTDGLDNQSRQLHIDEAKRLFSNVKVTVAIAGPSDVKVQLRRAGMVLPDGCFMSWSTGAELDRVTAATTAGILRHSEDIAKGKTSRTEMFFADIQQNFDLSTLVELTSQVQSKQVEKEGENVQTFSQAKFKNFAAGTIFYPLTTARKSGEVIQDYKMIVLRHRKTNKYYSATPQQLRALFGLPAGEIRVRAGNTGDYDVFIQSTSNNRKLPIRSEVLFWPGATAEGQRLFGVVPPAPPQQFAGPKPVSPGDAVLALGVAPQAPTPAAPAPTPTPIPQVVVAPAPVPTPALAPVPAPAPKSARAPQTGVVFERNTKLINLAKELGALNSKMDKRQLYEFFKTHGGTLAFETFRHRLR